MASRYYGANKGAKFTDVTEGSSSPSKAVELKIDLTAGLTREEALLIVEWIEAYINQHIWPPA